MAGPWEKYRSAPQGIPIGPQDPAAPQRGRKADLDVQTSEQNLWLQREDAERARRDQEMQERRFQWDQVQRQKDREAQTSAAVRESEDKAGSFLIRGLGSNEQYEATGEGPRSYVGQAMKDWTPNILNSLPGLIGNSPARQVADTSQDEFIAATLRQDSGAAIPEEELERQRRIYFPMPGDSPEAVAAKKQARQRAIEGLEMSAGRRAPLARENFSRLPPPQFPNTSPQEASQAIRDGEEVLRKGIAERTRGMTPQQARAFEQRAWAEYRKHPSIRGLNLRNPPRKPVSAKGWKVERID